jgi:hypothetical protein
MRRTRVTILSLALLMCGLVASVAQAADPGRWIQTAVTQTKSEYYQGITADPAASQLFFDGFQIGGYRTSLTLVEQARNESLLPPEVQAAEGFNHIGDWSYDAGGSRLILPLECYYPANPAGANTCGRGAFGIATRDLVWQGRVLLDPADIPKAMWAEVSPDGSLIWTSSGADLLAYRTADVQLAAGDVPVHPVRRLAGAVPPSGITGATFVGDRLLLAGQDAGPFQVWSVDLASGARRLEIERPWTGESEGLATVDALGGQLQWQIQPLDPLGRTPTFGTGHGTIVSFVSAVGARISLRATRPRHRRVTVTATLNHGTTRTPLAGVRISAAGRTVRTDARGRAVVRVPRRAGKVVVRASRPPMRPARLTIR